MAKLFNKYDGTCIPIIAIYQCFIIGIRTYRRGLAVLVLQFVAEGRAFIWYIGWSGIGMRICPARISE